MPENKIRVLLVEDTFSDAQLLERMLAKSKVPVFEVTHVTDLITASKELAAKAFDVVLLDLGLPDSIGATTVSRLRAKNSEIPIVVLTAVQVPQTILDAIKLGAQDYFVKSRLDADELMHKIIDAVLWRQALFGGPFADAAAHRTAGKVVRLLVVEDSEADVTLLRKMLASVKLVRFEILHAPTLDAAIKLLRSEVDIVLLDLNLPDSNGLQTLRSLRSEAGDIPIVLLTIQDSRDLAVTALEQGAQDYLLKGRADGSSIGQSLLRQLKKTTVES
jgi:DNA-binding response OmpR family regulator